MTSAPSRTGSAAALPKTADVVVIGGDVAGVPTTLFLARRGVSVVLCAKGRIAGEQSSRNSGWIGKMGRDLSGPAACRVAEAFRLAGTRCAFRAGPRTFDRERNRQVSGTERSAISGRIAHGVGRGGRACPRRSGAGAPCCGTGHSHRRKLCRSHYRTKRRAGERRCNRAWPD